MRIGSVVKLVALMACVALLVVLSNPKSNAQSSQGTGAATVGITGSNGTMRVYSFSLTFGTVGTSTGNLVVTGSITGSESYITVLDTKSTNSWYVTIDATNFVRSGSTGTLNDSNLRMTSGSGGGAVSTLSGGVTSEIVGVGNTSVSFSGTVSYTILSRNSITSGKIGRYGVAPTFILTIPAFTAVGSYAGTLELSMYTS